MCIFSCKEVGVKNDLKREIDIILGLSENELEGERLVRRFFGSESKVIENGERGRNSEGRIFRISDSKDGEEEMSILIYRL